MKFSTILVSLFGSCVPAEQNHIKKNPLRSLIHFLLDYARKLREKSYLCKIKLCDNDLNRNQHNVIYETPSLSYGLWSASHG